MRFEPAAAQILKPVRPSHDVEFPVSIEIVSDHLFAKGDVSDDAFGPWMLFGVIRNLEDLRRTVLALVIPTDERRPATRQQRRNGITVRPVSITCPNDVLFPSVLTQIDR